MKKVTKKNVKKVEKKPMKPEIKEIVEDRFILVDDVKENEDGSATVTLSMDDYTYSVFVRQGIRLAMPKKYQDKIMVTSPDFHLSNVPTKTVEFPEAELNAFLELAVIDAIKKGIKEAELKDSGK